MNYKDRKIQSLEEDLNAIGVKVGNFGGGSGSSGSNDDKVVTGEFLERVYSLPFSEMSVEDIDDLLNDLREMKLPDDKELVEFAEETVRRILNEKMKKIVVGGKVKKIRIRMDAKARAERRKRRMEYRRKKAKFRLYAKKRAKKARAKRLAMLTKRKKKMLGMESSSSIGEELRSLLSEQAGYEPTIRDEIVQSIEDIFVMLENEFNDESVSEAFIDAYGPLFDRWDANELTEDVMTDEEFHETIKPCIAIIAKSLEKLESIDAGDDDLLGNLRGLSPR